MKETYFNRSFFRVIMVLQSIKFTICFGVLSLQLQLKQPKTQEEEN
jgi:hypothetical protein